jgi:hypothetical protein
MSRQIGRRFVTAAALFLAAVTATSCAQLLGLDEPKDKPPLDASTDGAPTDGSSDAPPTCVPLPASPKDIYVDAAAAAGGYGSAGCPLQTITAALKIAVAGTTTVHVAAGRYDAAHGETFPLGVRGVSLVGAGIDQTIVEGTAPFAVDPTGGLVNAQTTILLGDPASRSAVSGLTIAASAISHSRYGIVCDRGNAPAARGATATPNSSVANVRFEPFDAALVATSADLSVESACNLLVTASSFVGSPAGIWTVADCFRVRPGLYVGDGTPASSNVFRQNTDAKGEGGGVRIWDGPGAVTVDTNDFGSADWGITIVQHHDYTPWLNHFVFKNNSIRGMSSGGVWVGWSTVIDDFSSNTIEGAVAPPGNAPAPALALLGEDERAPYYPAIGHARGNRIVGNDIGVAFYGSAALDPGSPVPVWDFGAQHDPGQNEIRCNSRANGGGYDLFVSTSANGPVTLTFDGNTWDHAPPSLASSTSAANGTDAVVVPAKVSITTSGATQGTTACPQGFSP